MPSTESPATWMLRHPVTVETTHQLESLRITLLSHLLNTYKLDGNFETPLAVSKYGSSILLSFLLAGKSIGAGSEVVSCIGSFTSDGVPICEVSKHLVTIFLCSHCWRGVSETYLMYQFLSLLAGASFLISVVLPAGLHRSLGAQH